VFNYGVTLLLFLGSEYVDSSLTRVNWYVKTNIYFSQFRISQFGHSLHWKRLAFFHFFTRYLTLHHYLQQWRKIGLQCINVWLTNVSLFNGNLTNYYYLVSYYWFPISGANKSFGIHSFSYCSPSIKQDNELTNTFHVAMLTS